MSVTTDTGIRCPACGHISETGSERCEVCGEILESD